jgi:hypothetical protein
LRSRASNAPDRDWRSAGAGPHRQTLLPTPDPGRGRKAHNPHRIMHTTCTEPRRPVHTGTQHRPAHTVCPHACTQQPTPAAASTVCALQWYHNMCQHTSTHVRCRAAFGRGRDACCCSMLAGCNAKKLGFTASSGSLSGGLCCCRFR